MSTRVGDCLGWTVGLKSAVELDNLSLSLSDFLRGDTFAVSVEIHSASCFRDPLVGTVRFLLSNCLSETTQAFTVAQVRRLSGRFPHRPDLVEKSRRRRKNGSEKSEKSYGSESDGANSTASSRNSQGPSSLILPIPTLQLLSTTVAAAFERLPI
ncbi:hypothetical protein RHGRI_014952 [Rhododendron griersonianum]|uniref:Uncharacterized protein n=1 Tax=Rhododendron griersonianum TaxID=479676 RepID=A0AAV6KBW7_9ERIC|nr:hypothetical protein RHGRI_014952 [Rhododendron griersonianum]